MKTIIYCSIVSLLVSCQVDSNGQNYFSTPDNLDKSLIVPTDTVGTLKIIVQKPDLSINASDFIAETKYIPLETTDESLIGYCCNVIIYKDRIYILDYSMAESDVKFRFSGVYEILPCGMIVSQTSKHHSNFHLNDYGNFRLIFTDSLGNITKFGFPFDDNINVSIVWSGIIVNNNKILYHPQYLNGFYYITDSIIRQKYEIDLRNFNPFNLSRITEFRNTDDFNKYYYSTNAIEPYFAETHSHFYFSLLYNKRNHMYFYDKESGNMVGFKQRNYEYDKGKTFYVETGIEYPQLFNTDDYFIGPAAPNALKDVLKNRRTKGLETPPETVRMIEGLQEDDNPVLVLFKIKRL